MSQGHRGEMPPSLQVRPGDDNKRMAQVGRWLTVIAAVTAVAVRYPTLSTVGGLGVAFGK